MKCYFDHYGEKENNFAQITILDEYDEKIDVINIESINKKDFKKLYNTITEDINYRFIYENYNDE